MKLSHSVTRCLLTTCCCRYNSVTVFYCASVSGASTPRCYTLCHYLSARCVTLSIITCQPGVLHCLALITCQPDVLYCLITCQPGVLHCLALITCQPDVLYCLITCQPGVMYCLSLPVSQVCYTVSHCLSTRSAVHCKRFIPSIGKGRHR